MSAMTQKKIMVVEDEVLVSEHLRETLNESGYKVTAAVSSGEDAVFRATEDRPDIILMDIVLQGEMDGIAAAEIINRVLGIPVVYITANTEKNMLKRAKITNPYAYVTKPFDEQDLLNTIEVALYRKKLDKELAEYRTRLEKKVFLQAEDLKKTNRNLHRQLNKLETISTSLKEKSKQLEEANAALRYLLKQREQDEIRTGELIRTNVNEIILPHLNALQKTSLNSIQKAYLDLLNNNIEALLKPFVSHLTSRQIGLTTMELKVADLVKNGKRNKEIGEILCIAVKTVEFHRENIRKKLGVCNRKVNLRTYLNTM